jgi:ubiquinone/menaquinone biosynthesis C-methylase UbiE
VHNRRVSPTIYTLGSTDAELQRLIELASHEEDRVIDACARAGIGEGATVADFGCGPLGALAALSRVVGRSGHVIGVDASSAALDKAGALLPKDQFPQLRLLHLELHQLTSAQLGVEAIDQAYCRLMLLHQPDPEQVLRKMASLVRPGGVVITHEPSDLAMHAPASEPAVPAMTRVWELVVGAARARGAQTDFGRRGRQYLEAAGLEVVAQRAYVVHYRPAIGYDIPRVALNSLRPVLAEKNLATAEEIERLEHELLAARNAAHVQWVSSPLMFEWIARKTR